MKINIALALTSAVFLMVWVTSFVSAIFRFMPVTRSDPAISDLLASGLLFIAVIELLSIISFSGSVLFLLEARQILSRWYLGVPLCVFMFLLVIVNLLIYSGGKPISCRSHKYGRDSLDYSTGFTVPMLHTTFLILIWAQ